ncbi:MAG: MerR family transcriptional regulator [Christensenellaceae bacterium]|jgi:DNA-binding transcriptional MerR regulator
MKSYFSIGETAQINHVPIKTLRYYDEIGLLKPAYINEETGYRYYTPEQFYFIDAIKYGKMLRLPLKDIGKMISDESGKNMYELLLMQKKRAQEEIETFQKMLRNIDHTLDDMAYVKKHRGQAEGYVREKPDKYIVVSFAKESFDIESIDIRLKKLISIKEFQPYLTYRYGFFVDTKAFMANEVRIVAEYIELSEKPPLPHESLHTLAVSQCMCFQRKMLSSHNDFRLIQQYIRQTGFNSDYIVADEITYESSWEESIYELCFDL